MFTPPNHLLTFDLEFDGISGAISPHLFLHAEPTLVDPGPTPTVDRLIAVIEQAGLPATELRHILLTHVHLDHAGGTGELMRRYPALQVHVHEDAGQYLVDPEGLVASTRRTFGDAHDRLWGEVTPIQASRIRGWRPGDTSRVPGMRPVPTPGHIDHHLAWLREDDGVMAAGDALGIILHPEGPVHPATPAPAIDLGAWHRTLDEIRAIGPEWAAIAHFGLHTGPGHKADALAAALHQLELRVRVALKTGRADSEVERYEADVRASFAEVLPREQVDRYFDVFSGANDWAGARRAVEKGRV